MRSKRERDELRKQIASVSAWYHQFDFGDGITTPGVNNTQQMLANLDLPARMDGARVLDIGTRDGFFAFECERRGAAEIVAVDYIPRTETGFDVAAHALGSTRVQYVQENVYHMSPELYGQFDLVLFLGLLYHLPDPLGALAIIRALTKETAYVETQMIDEAVQMPDGSFESLPDALMQMPLMQFYRSNALNDDPTNFWAPNAAALMAMLIEVGFTVDWMTRSGMRGIARCTAIPPSKAAYYLSIARGTIAI